MRDVALTVVRGLGFGSVYALLAVSFVIIYKSSKVISFAQPALMLAGAVLVSYLAGPVGFYLAVPLAAIAIAMLGWGLERTTIRPMIGRPVFVVAIITLGLDIAIRVVVNVFIGPDVRNVTLQDLCAVNISEHLAIGLIDRIAFHEVTNALDPGRATPTTCASVIG